MLPPWLQYPHIPLGSLAWRMGAAEDFWYAFQDWFAAQPEPAQAAYILQHPEPPGNWQGFYARTLHDFAARLR